MNALTIGSYAAIAVIGFLVLYKLYKLVKAEGASQQKDKTNRKVNSVAAKVLKRVIDGTYGTRAWRVLKPGKWKPTPKP